MIEIEFNSPPDGYVFRNPDRNLIETLVLYAESLYWNSGAGSSLIEFKENGLENLLTLTFHKDLGFQIEIKIGDQPYYVSLNEEGSFEKTVTVYIGGNETLLPSRFFVSREEAASVVEYFCETGGKSEEIEWGLREEQNWHYGR